MKRIADHLTAKGYDVAKEVPVGGGKTIDIVATRQGKRIAFEIETGKSDTAANVKKCRDAGLDEIVVVATSDLIRNKISRNLSKSGQAKLLTPSDLLR